MPLTAAHNTIILSPNPLFVNNIYKISVSLMIFCELLQNCGLKIGKYAS